jgi:diguanylate cyclase (GGDEF)-like protein/PAS domain S-box-containing protein/putative nucleotidyltransferase with HDIG domain
MNDQDKTREQLVGELAHLRRLVAELKASEAERQRVETALQDSEELSRGLLQAATVGTYIVQDGKFQYVNPQFERISGYQRDELLGTYSLEYVHPDDRELVRNKAVEDLKNDSGLSYEFRFMHKDGRPLWILERVASIQYEGRPAAVGSFMDITERKQAEQALMHSEYKYRTALESARDGIIITDTNGLVMDINRTLLIALGYDSKEQVIGRSSYELLAVEQPQNLDDGIRQALIKKGHISNLELTGLTRDGREVPVEVNISLMTDEDGQNTGAIVVIRDITERKRVQEEMLRHSKRLEVLNAISIAVSQSLDLSEMLNSALEKVLQVIEIEAGYIHLFDMEKGELVLKAHRGVPEQYVAAIERMELREEAIERWQTYPEPAFKASKIITEDANAAVTMAEGEDNFELFISVPLWSKSGMHGGLTLVGRKHRHFSNDELDLLKAIGNEIAVGIENARLLEKMRELSITDEMTGLNNRRHFYEVLEAEIGRTQRYGLSFSVAMLDLDEFKEFNDKYGHTNGDVVLRSLGERLQSSLRKSDVAFRYGGDEFAIILPSTDAASAKKIVDRIRSEWAEAPKVHNLLIEGRLGFSVGIAQYPENAETADGLVFLADTALYRSKREGGYKTTLVSDLGTLASGAIDRHTLDHVYALAATVDARDPYTYGHSKRVAAISEMIGKAIRLSQSELAQLRGAALLHDIGKVGVPDSTLGKPGKLTEKEWEVIRKHSAEGARIVGHVKALAALVPIIKHHHEWYDGTGYPDGLKGERIPVGARIISIADAYDTMTTRRPYREPMSREEALGELRRCCGTQFDPILVGVFGEALRGAVWRGPVKKKSPSLARK